MYQLLVSPVKKGFVAEVHGLDARQPLASDVFLQLNAALLQYAVVVVPGQALTQEEQVGFARQFGELEKSVGASIYNRGGTRRLERSELSDISNLDEKEDLLSDNDVRRLINLSNQLWHTDSSFKEVPATYSMLSAQEIPPVGGFTEFADMRQAWCDLEEQEQRQLIGKVAVHDYFYSRSLTGFDTSKIPEEWRERQPPVRQRLVCKHPETGVPNLYLASHIRSIEGMSNDASQVLLSDLMEHATQDKYCYQHRWRVNDLIIWDNRCTMHRGRPFSEAFRRGMRRATVGGCHNTLAEEAFVMQDSGSVLRSKIEDKERHDDEMDGNHCVGFFDFWCQCPRKELSGEANHHDRAIRSWLVN